MPGQESLLIVEDNRSSAILYQAWLSGLVDDIRLAHSGAEVIEQLNQGLKPAVVLLDMHLPDTTGLSLLEQLRTRQLTTKVVVITSDASAELAVEAMKEGAHDYLLKPVDDYRLSVSISNTLRAARLESLANGAGQFQQEEPPTADFIGSSLPMQALYKTLKLAALSDAPVFISGESGTGKELCAQAIHELSQRSKAPLVSVNCATMPVELVESQLFGHTKGAFTGAIQNRRGLCEEAHNGTLFLDELTELSLDVQSKLLRFLQTGEITPVGSSVSKKVNCRVVCASNIDIRKAVSNGLFREDLFYRLHVIPVQLPPLRHRGDDIIQLAGTFLQRYSAAENRHFKGFTPAAIQALLDYSWPGNVRELQNSIRQAVVMHYGEQVEPRMLALGSASLVSPATTSATNPAQTKAHSPTSLKSLAQVEREAIDHAMQHFAGNITKVAAALEVAPSTLYRKLKQYQGNT